MAFFDRLRRLVPGPDPSDPFARGTRALNRGRLDEAAAAFDEALADALRDTQIAGAEKPAAAHIAAVRNKRAILAIRRGDRERAIVELILALEAEPRSAAAITTVGNLLLEDGAFDDAIVHYEHAILVDEAYAPAYHNLGVALHRTGRRGEAVRHLRKATRLEGRMKRS